MATNGQNDTRIAQDLLPPGVLHQNLTHPMTDVRRGGQFGWQPDMKGIINATPYTSNNLICKVLASPRGFNDLRNAEIWHGAFKAMFETQALTIEGLNKQLSPSWVGTPMGGAGEEMEVPVGMTREKSAPVFTLNDTAGLPFTHLIEQYHRLFIQNENTKHPGIALINRAIPDGLIDYYTWTMIFIEPNRYWTHAVRTWLVTAMGIKSSPENAGKRDLNSDHELADISVEMTGVSQVGIAIDQLGTSILMSMGQSLTDPQRAPAFMRGTTADLADLNTVGFQERMEEDNREMIAPDV